MQGGSHTFGEQMETLPYSKRESNYEDPESDQPVVYYRPLVLLTDVERYIGRTKEKISLDAFGTSWPQAKLIMYLARHQIAIQVKIASDLHHDEGALSRLERFGLVERLPNAKDRRSRCICLTEEGMRLAKDLSSRFGKLDDHLFAIFAEDEKSRLIQILKRLLCNGLDDAVLR
jgi:DNA-binding MarR family transcriptional regulator